MKKFLSLALFVSAMFAANVVHCQSAVTILSGSTSQGGGGATVALNGTTLKTDVYFANLDAKSTGAYILCCDADPALSRVATASLIQAVVGNTFGSSVVDFDVRQTAFWDSTFSGGDVDAARQRLSAALGSGQAHFVVTSVAYPSIPGEISGKFALPLTAASMRTRFAQQASARNPPDPLFTMRTPLDDLISMRTEPGRPYGLLQYQPSGVFANFLSASTNDFRCSGASERCVFPVYVSSTYNDQKVAVACEARVDYGVITVPPHRAGKTLRIVWQLVEGDVGDPGDYRFMDAGIDLAANNDPRQDFNGKGRESADGKRYKWLRVGARVGQRVAYNAWVERFDPTTGRSLPCRPADPMIANEN